MAQLEKYTTLEPRPSTLRRPFDRGEGRGTRQRSPRPMDIQTIDNAYQQLQSEGAQTSAKLQALAAKLQAAAQAGDQNAREWLLDLREVALSVQTEEAQVGSLLQAMHAFAVTQMQGAPAQGYPPQPGYAPPGYPAQGFPPPGYPQQGYPQQSYPQSGGNPLSGFLSSGFGRAVEAGLGFGIGDDLINKIF